MKICHFSDFHGQFKRLPYADLYVCTGDMLPNFPLKSNDIYFDRIIDSAREILFQTEWVNSEINRGGFRRYFSSKDAPVIVVRGNHDFIDLAQAFGGDVHEITTPEKIIEIGGLRFGGIRGINYIAGEWSDELSCDEFNSRMQKVSNDINVLITHAPPFGILDFYYENLGSRAIRSYIDNKLHSEKKQIFKAHLFGHIHEGMEILSKEDIIFSNAATTYRVIEI